MNDPQPPLPPDGPATGPTSAGAPPVDAPTPPTPPPAGSPHGFFGAVRRLGVQRTDDRWVAGVCSGVADRFGIDPLVVRGVLGVALLLGGAGAVAYGIAWALLPERRDGRIHLEETIAGRFDVAIVGAAALVVLGAGRGSDAWGGGWGPGPHWVGNVLDALGGLLWFGFIGALVVAAVMLVTRSQRERPRPPAPTTPYGQPPYGQPPYGTAPSGSAPSGTAPFGTAPSGTAPSGQPPYGPAASGHPPYGHAPYAPAPYGQAPAGRPSSGQAYGQAYGQAPYRPADARTSAPSPSGPSAAQPASVWTHHGSTAHARVPSTPAPPAPASAPRPAPKPRRHGPGAASLGVVVALALLTLAALLAASRTGAFDGPVVLTTLGVTAVLAGLGIVVAGLRGRTSGSLGFLAIAALVVALPAGAVSDSGWMRDEGTRWGSSTVAVSSRDAAADGLQVGAGETTFDLTAVPLTASTLTVPVSVGAGRAVVVVPQDAAVAADVRLGLGSVTWDVDGSSEQVGGAGIEHQTFQDQASTDGTAQILLDISVGLGDVTVTREDA